MNVVLIVGALAVVGVVGGVGYHMYVQAKNPPSAYNNVRRQTEEFEKKRQVDEQNRLAQEEKNRDEQETRQRICNLRTVDDVKDMFLWQNGKTDDGQERFLKELALSPIALDEYIANSKKQVGGCNF